MSVYLVKVKEESEVNVWETLSHVYEKIANHYAATI